MTAPRPITSDQRKQLRTFILQRLNKAIKEVGLDREGFQRLLTRGGEFLDYLVEGIRRFSSALPDWTLAQTILGKDFISPEEVAKARGVTYTDGQLEKLGQTLPSQEVLEWCRDNGYGLMPVPPIPLSLLGVRRLDSKLFYAKEGGWYFEQHQKFAHNDMTGSGWLAMRKTVVEGSTSKNWDEQQKLVTDLERVPNAAELAWFVTTYHAVRATYLFGGVYARTSSVGADGDRVLLGNVDAGGLLVGYFWDHVRSSFLGLSSARKF